ncbi:MAG: hypothetical protein ACRD6Q_03465 [Nitrososphaeraceae archaeon]
MGAESVMIGSPPHQARYTLSSPCSPGAWRASTAQAVATSHRETRLHLGPPQAVWRAIRLALRRSYSSPAPLDSLVDS